jgi:hypothetical protein
VRVSVFIDCQNVTMTARESFPLSLVHVLGESDFRTVRDDRNHLLP